MKPLRIAFLTNEFLSANSTIGGLGTYLDRITHALKEIGHKPEVFLISSDQTAVTKINGIRLEHVQYANKNVLKSATRLTNRLLRAPWGGPLNYINQSMGLARALERRHSQLPFDLVQSTNIGASGLFVRRSPGRRHIARLSSLRDLWFEVDGRLHGIGPKMMCWLERAAIQRADLIYAPSQYLANYSREVFGLDVKVLRPPMIISERPCVGLLELPPRYLIHFGQIGARKGSDTIAKALPSVWEQEPEFTMVWAGREIKAGIYEQLSGLWGSNSSNVHWLGQLKKELLFGILKGAEAAVLPSRVDNFPNTVIESIMFGIPVIGSDGASINELVENGVSGELVPIGDTIALSRAMLKVWRHDAEWLGSGFRPPSIINELSPEKAAENLICLAGYCD